VALRLKLRWEEEAQGWWEGRECLAREARRLLTLQAAIQIVLK
jgi:hypothetical protein